MKKVLIFGTGEGAKKVISALSKTRIKVIAYVDSNKEKQGKLHKGKIIIAPEEIKNYEYDYIVIGSSYYKEINKNLNSIGITSDTILSFFDYSNYKKYLNGHKCILSLIGRIKTYFKCKNKAEEFNPTIYSIFTNPFYIIRRGIYKAIKKNIHYMNGRMLDFGCGDKPYRELFNVDNYIGLDIEQSGHSHNFEDIDVFYDGKNIPFSKEYFDSVFSSEVLEHVFELKDIIKEINRVLKINGNLLITVPFVWDEHEIPYDFARYTSFGIKYILEKNGFKIVNLSKSNDYVSAIFQMWVTYIYEILPRNKVLRIIFSLVLIFPANCIGSILSKVLPYNDGFYNNNIVVARKIKSITED